MKIYNDINKRPFVTKKELSSPKKLSDEIVARRAYICAHNFTIDVNPSTKEPEVKITKR